MVRLALILSVLLLFVASPVLAEVNSHNHASTVSQSKGTTTVTLQDDALVLTFGPIDLPARHSGDLAPEGASVKPIKAYTVGVNVVCYSQFSKRPSNESDEGRELKPGIVQVDSKPLKFTVDACVKYAYPHGHDGLLMIALDDKTTNQTLLRSVPDVENGGNLRWFRGPQVYSR